MRVFSCALVELTERNELSLLCNDTYLSSFFLIFAATPGLVLIEQCMDLAKHIHVHTTFRNYKNGR